MTKSGISNVIKLIKEKLIKLSKAGALHITVGTFLTKFVAFFGSIVVVRLLSKNDYGVMSYVENIYSYALLFAGLGLPNAVLRYLVITDDNIEKKRYFNYIIKRSIIIDVAIGIILCIAIQLFSIPDNYDEAKLLVPIAALLLPFQDLLAMDLNTIRSFFKNKFYAYASFITSALLIIGRILGAKISGVSGVLWSRVLINSVFSVLGLIYLLNLFFPKQHASRLSQEERHKVNVYSFQYMITNGLWALFMLNDTFLLGLLLNDPSGLADYKVAYVMPGNISIFATAIGTFVGPYFTKNENDKAWIRRNYKKVYLLSAATVGIVALIIAVLARPLITFMYGDAYLNVVNLMRMLLLAAFINSGLRFTTANILAAMGEIKYNMVISGIGIGVQILLDLVLIPKLGAMAVAVSNCIVYLFMALSLSAVFYKRYYSL